MKRRHASSTKTGETTSGGSAKNPFKSQNQQGPSSKKKGTDREGRKQGQKRKQVTQAVKRKAKEHEDYTPAGEKGSSKKVKLTSAKMRSWQILSESSRRFLETVMDSVILSVLCQQREKKDDVQKHLNLLKERVLRRFKALKVPQGKLGNLKNVLSLQMAEKQMLEANEESLVQLQEEINEAKRSAEHIEETTQQLQYKIQVLKNQLEGDEKKARKVFQENVSGVLHLPELPKRSLQAPTLQEEILKIKNQEGLLNDMNTIQQSADLNNMLTLIEKTYEKVHLISVRGAVNLCDLTWEHLKLFNLTNLGFKQNEMDDFDHYTNAHAVFYKELQAYQELLEDTTAINWGQIFRMQVTAQPYLV